jgi:hypothetical protein
MLIVMDSVAVRRAGGPAQIRPAAPAGGTGPLLGGPGQPAGQPAARAGGAMNRMANPVFSEMMAKDLIPIIDST